MIARVVALVEGDTTETPTDTTTKTDSEISETAEGMAPIQPGQVTAEKLLDEIRRRTEHLDPTDLAHLQSLTADLDEIAEALTSDLGLDERSLAEITRALGIVSSEIGLTIPEAVAKLKALGLDD
jgi:hypothetical protein